METIKDDNVFELFVNSAIETCDVMTNCNECTTQHKKLDGNLFNVPCNDIRRKYGVSIWDYKKRGDNKCNI